jgi:hypothetical protein
MTRAQQEHCAARDEEDVLKGFGAHSDQERMPENSVANICSFTGTPSQESLEPNSRKSAFAPSSSVELGSPLTGRF